MASTPRGPSLPECWIFDPWNSKYANKVLCPLALMVTRTEYCVKKSESFAGGCIGQTYTLAKVPQNLRSCTFMVPKYTQMASLWFGSEHRGTQLKPVSGQRWLRVT